ncbi:MAG: hypothetical protein SW833_13160 [Cyanobacteriota bacterium]|nr:hypothetical protein [Cyanobacteriota bacterium]
MKSWEFLIQKKENPAWLSLKTQKLKLEAGEYRLVARSHRPNVDVEVRVTYQGIEETGAKPRSQKRQQRTNAEGLLAVVPFINFQPGLWQIACRCDLMAELLGEPWQEVVQLQVLPSMEKAEGRGQKAEGRREYEFKAEGRGQKAEGRREYEFKAEGRGQKAEGRREYEFKAEGRGQEAEGRRQEAEGEIQKAEGNDFDSEERQQTAEQTTPSLDKLEERQQTAEQTTPSLDKSEERQQETERTTPSLDKSEITPLEDGELPQNAIAADKTTRVQLELPPLNATATDTDAPVEETEIPQEIPQEIQNAIAPPTADSSSPEIDPEETAAIESLLDRSIQNLEQILASANQPETPPEPTEPAPLPNSAIAEVIEKLQLRLTLYHENFVRHQGESLLISGQVDAIDPDRNDLATPLASLAGQHVQLVLRYLLRDPQTSTPREEGQENERVQTLFNSQDPTGGTTLPKIFGYRLEVPQEYRTPLILGEVVLEIVLGSEIPPCQSENIIARSPFTIAAAVEELLEAAFGSQQSTDGNLPSLPQLREVEPEPPTLKTDLLDLANQPHHPSSASPASRQVLPPKLSPPAAQKAARSLKLPKFPGSQETQPSEGEGENEPFAGIEEATELPGDEFLQTEIAAPEAEVGTFQETSVEEASPSSQIADDTFPSPELEDLWAEPDEGQGAEVETFQEAAVREAEEETSVQEIEEEPPAEPSELDRAFQSLHLEDRFWSRMNSLVEDAPLFAAEQPPDEEDNPHLEEGESQPSDEEGETFETIPAAAQTSAVDVPIENLFADGAPVEEPLFVEPAPASSASSSYVAAAAQPLEESDWTANEIVVDEEEETALNEPPRDSSGLPYPPTLEQNRRPVLPEVAREPGNRLAKSRSQSDEPIPTPILEVAEGELVAGEAAFVRVKLPGDSDSVYVKLWVVDCQTRSLLDGPRALLDLSVNGEGELEAMTQMSVPLGSLEIRFEAIAIAIDTQQESRKASLSRAVIPPNLPNTLYNEF